MSSSFSPLSQDFLKTSRLFINIKLGRTLVSVEMVAVEMVAVEMVPELL